MASGGFIAFTIPETRRTLPLRVSLGWSNLGAYLALYSGATLEPHRAWMAGRLWRGSIAQGKSARLWFSTHYRFPRAEG